MTKSKISASKKKIGRPATGIGTLIGIRWHQPVLTKIEEWRRWQPDLPSRGDAIRRLVELGLKAKAKTRSTK